MLLIVDTALDVAQAAVVADGQVQGEAFAVAAGDAEAVVAHAAAALRQAGARWADIRGVAVTVGPGSFTGVRVGMSFAKGVAFALGVPATGVTTLAAIGHDTGADVVAVIDARHGFVFAALVRGGIADAAGRMVAAHAVRLASEASVGLAGPPSALAAVGMAGRRVDRLDPRAIARASAGFGAISPPAARYFAPVEAAPQRHKALARAPS